MKYESVPFSTAFIELGGTYISRKGKTRNQIRHEIRDIKAKKYNSNQDPENDEIKKVEKNILIYESALNTFPPDSEEWYMCQFELEKEKSRYELLTAKSGGGKNS